MRVDDSGPSLTIAMLDEFEEHFNLELPQDYRLFMIEHNGGRPEEDWVFDFIEAGSEGATSSVLCDFYFIDRIDNDSLYSIASLYQFLVEEELIPPSLLPIACDPGGNYLLLCVSERDYGKVCFGNHELADSETGYYIMSLIADSFTEFIESLYLDQS